MLQELKIGEPYLPIVGKPEGIFFEIRETGTELIYNFASPNPSEIDQLRSEASFEVRLVEKNGVLFILAKCGNLEWADAPYNPRLSAKSANGDLLDTIEDKSQGYGLTLIMTDAPKGIIKSMRLIGLGNKFSRKLKDVVEKNMNAEMTVQEYDKNVNYVMANYTTKQLLDYSIARFKLEG